jgi:hypothetical protein
LGLSSFDETYPYAGNAHLTSASGTTPATLWSQGSTPSRVDAILVRLVSASDQTVLLTYAFSGVDREVGRWVVPANTGDGTVPIMNLFATLPEGMDGIKVPAGVSLKAGMVAALTGSDSLEVNAFGGVL